MNGFELAGRRLKVGPSNSAQTAQAGATPGMPLGGPVAVGGLAPGSAVPLMPAAPAPAPAAPVSRMVVLENLVGVDEVDDDLEAEIKEECEVCHT